MSFRFQDRAQGGRLLADKLADFFDRPEVIVLGLPRGGVPVSFEVAQRLHAPLDVFMVRKLGVPGHEELAMGAIASGNIWFLNENIVRHLQISPVVIEEVIARERRELERREQAFRIGDPLDLSHKTVILIDDGLATGASMRAAILAARERHPARIIAAAPVAAEETYWEFKERGDEMVCVQTPPNFQGVGQWYEDFSQTTDEEVRAILKQASALVPANR